MTWKLTRSLSFEHIEQQLIQLCDRLSEQGKTADECYADICCSWISKLQSIFGPQLRAFLDIFHAVQRIAQKIPKWHPYHKHCLQSLTLVFRDPSDQGTKGDKTHPSPTYSSRKPRKISEPLERCVIDSMVGKSFHQQLSKRLDAS